MTTASLASVVRYLRDLGTGDATDGQLLQRFAAHRDEAAFAALVRRHGPLVLGVCRRVLRHQQDAEDAFQATFLVLARKAGALRQPDALGPWLYGVASRTAVKARVGARRRRAHERRLRPPPATGPADDLVWRDLRPVLDEAIGRLPEKYRRAVVLCYLEGKTNAEAALLLGCSRGTVATLLARARQRLRARLTGRGVALSAGLLAAGLAAEATAAIVAPGLAAATVTGALEARSGLTMAAPAAALAKGVLRTMLAKKLAGMAAIVLVVGAGATGVGVRMRQAAAEGHARDAAPSSTEKGGADKPDGAKADPVEFVCARLRETHCCRSPGDWVLWAERVDGRQLSGVCFFRYDRDKRGLIETVVECRNAEVRSGPKDTVLFHMHHGQIRGEDGAVAFFEARIFPVDPPLAVAPPETDTRASRVTLGRELLAAFAKDSFDPNAAAIKVRVRSRGLTLAADEFRVEPDGRVRLAPCHLVLDRTAPGQPDAGEPTVVRATAVYLTCDGPVTSAADLGRRKITAIEPTGDVSVSIRPGK